MDAKSRTFTPFPRFPKEIRLKIWELAQPIRIVCVRLTPPPSWESHIHDPKYRTHLWPLLATNQESREHTLKSYVAIHEFFVPQHFYFNAARDTLYMPDHMYSFDSMLSLRKFGGEGVGQKLRSLALPQSTVETILGDLTDLKEATDLDELFVIGRAYGYDSDTPGVEMMLPRKTRPEPDEDDIDLWSFRGQEGVAAKFEVLSKRFPEWKIPRLIAVTDEYWAYRGVNLRGYTK